MTAQQLMNLGVLSGDSALGFNTDRGIADLLEAADSLWLFTPDTKIAPGTDVDSAYITSLQKAGKLVIVKGISTFQETGSDDATETLEDDTMILANQGKYKFTATFAGKGLYYNRAIDSIRGHSNWRVAIVDKKGDVFLTHNSELETYGFTVGMIKNNKLAVASNTTTTKSGVDFQLLYRYELDQYPVRWENDNLDFDPRLVEPITQVWLEFVNQPADTDVVLTVKATIDRGRLVNFSGATFDDWTNETPVGTTSDPTAGDDAITEGTYILTVPALVSANSGQLRLYDTNDNSPVVEVGGSLYKSNVVPYSVT